MSQQHPTPRPASREPHKPAQRPQQAQQPSLDRLLVERYGDLARSRRTR